MSYAKYIKGQRSIKRVTDARLDWHPVDGNSAEAFQFSGIKSGGKVATSSTSLKRALGRLCEVIVGSELDLPTLREFLRLHPKSIVALSRSDLLSFSPNVSTGDLDETYDVIYGESDRWVSQQVKLVNHRVVIEPWSTEEDPIFFDGTFPTGGKRLLKAINQQIGAPRQANLIERLLRFRGTEKPIHS